MNKDLREKIAKVTDRFGDEYYMEGFPDDYEDDITEIIKLCAEAVKDEIYELYPDFEPTANTILLAIDSALIGDKDD